MTVPQNTVAILTPLGRGAVASVRVELVSETLTRFDQSLFRAANGRPLAQQLIGRIVYGSWGREFTQHEDVVVCRIAERAFEIHCHGGDVAVRRIVADWKQIGCEVVSWQQQLVQSSDQLELDFQEALSDATTWRTTEILLEQSSGLLRKAFEHLQQLSVAIHDQSSRGCGQSSTNNPETCRTDLIAELDALLSWSQFGRHLSRPWNVVLTGRPNVGKSSLINALLGYQRAIVFDEPGTTRDAVTAETAFEGWPVQLVDTAGLRDATDELEAAGIEIAWKRLDSADVRLVVIDVSEAPTESQLQLQSRWPQAIVVGHKCDLVDLWGSNLCDSAVRVSSVSGAGIHDLQRILVERLVPAAPPIGTAVPINDRQTRLLVSARDAARAGKHDATIESIAKLFLAR